MNNAVFFNLNDFLMRLQVYFFPRVYGYNYSVSSLFVKSSLITGFNTGNRFLAVFP